VLQRSGSQPVGFLQFFHLHRHLPLVQQLISSPALAGTAAQLLGAQRVRLYQVSRQASLNCSVYMCLMHPDSACARVCLCCQYVLWMLLCMACVL
jgi:hypothetical protein